MSDVISDCNSQIQKTAFDWYRQFEKKENVLRILLEDQIDMKATWGFGNMDSPHRNEYIAYTAIELGQTEIAIEKLQKLLTSIKEQYQQTKYDYYLEKIIGLEEKIKRIKATHKKV